LEFAWPFVPGDLAYYSVHEAYRQLYKQVGIGDIPPGNRAIVDAIDHAMDNFVYQPMNKIRVLDYGCGSGFYAAHLKHRGCDVVGADFNPEMVRVAQEHFGIKVFIKSAEELLIEEWKFDLIILNHVLEHIGDPAYLLNTLGKLLIDGGIIFISVPNRNYIRTSKKLREGKLPEGNYPPHHISFWSIRSLSMSMSAAGFKVLQCSAQTYPEAIQAEISLTDRFGKIGKVPRVIALLASYAGSLLNLPGVNLFAVGSVHE